MNRRNFLQQIVVLSGVAVLFPILAQSEERRRGGGAAAATGPVLVDPKDPQAVALNYVENHKDLKNKALQVDRSGVKWLDQKCLNCSFYDKTKETKINGKTAAPCQLFPGKSVVQPGWCTTWAKKV
jgi:High potential iron-sulfur protein